MVIRSTEDWEKGLRLIFSAEQPKFVVRLFKRNHQDTQVFDDFFEARDVYLDMEEDLFDLNRRKQ